MNRRIILIVTAAALAAPCALVAAEPRRARLFTAVKKNPADLKSRMRLLKMLVLDYDDPAGAAAWP